jgi:hypothetical protein
LYRLKCVGIWATAPYLHNGSVPTPADLLDSSKRPEFWQRSSSNTTDNYFEKVGWPYEIMDEWLFSEYD